MYGKMVEAGGAGIGTATVHEDLSALADRAVSLVDRWLIDAAGYETKADRRTTQRLSGVVADPAGVEFAMAFVDRVIRPEDDRVAAEQLGSLVHQRSLPAFLSPIDRTLLRAGAEVGRFAPSVVMPLARRRMRSLIGHLIVDADAAEMTAHLGARRDEGFHLNVNLLGEAVLGDREAARRHAETLRLLDHGAVDYVSVKVSSVVSQLNYWDFDGCAARVIEALRPIFERAQRTDPQTFVNLDMEEYHDLELTMHAFRTLLDEPQFHDVDAGIVLQAYLPDSFEALRSLSDWATERGKRIVDGKPGGTVKVRLVKGANLAMEQVEAELHGWNQAPYVSKAETDANYKRCLDWLMTPERMASMRVGVASHNLFDLAFAKLLAEDRGVADRVEFEMLEGMAPGQARLLVESDSMLLYTPAVAADQFDVAISYLFRRLEENASDDNFIHHLFSLRPGSAAAIREADRFRQAVSERWNVSSVPNRRQDRANPAPISPEDGFTNAADTDPALPANRSWVLEALRSTATEPQAALIDSTNAVDEVVTAARSAQPAWANRTTAERRAALYTVANELERRRGDLVATMVHEANKTVAEADPEVTEAIDFARYYGERAVDLDAVADLDFNPLGSVLVAPPWNFPVAIPTGGVMAALAAGNSVVLKPAPETHRCAEIIAECCWAAGIPRDVVQYVRVPDNDVGRHLIAHPDIDAVILTGAYETAELFRSWKSDLRIFAETSGKNSLIITPNADLDLAVADLVASAFGHSGQKCSAASLAILVGDVYHSDRFRRQLEDAVSSLRVGRPDDLSTTMGPTIAAPAGKLLRALTELDPGERWLVQPREVEPGFWTPGVRDAVQQSSWFHHTECFGPVLGLMQANDLDEALAIQNATQFGLTGGIHSLDAGEIEHWLDHVEVGNAYVNRATTGAIVQRQPFGGWKRSTIGPGAKAGGPNYVAQLGIWHPAPDEAETEEWLIEAKVSDDDAWKKEFGVEHDPTGLEAEANRFRYRPAGRIVLRIADGREIAGRRALSAAKKAGCDVVVSREAEESAQEFVERLRRLDATRLRVIGACDPAIRAAAHRAGVDIADAPVVGNGRIELLHYLREQAISQTMHRYGNRLAI